MKKIFFVLLVLSHLTTSAQIQQQYSLLEAITKGQSESPTFRLIETERQISFFQYQAYKSDFRPQISVYGNLPVFNKEFYGVRQPDGTIRYQSISQNNANLGISLSQQILFTGGELSLNTDLTRFDDFKAKTRQYSGTPIYLRLTQPIFAVNPLKWQKKIEPIRFLQASKEFFTEMEEIARQLVLLYFDVIDAQTNIDISIVNLANTEANYEIEKKRIDLGTTTEDKLLQLELQTLRSRQELEKAKYQHQLAQLRLSSFIGITKNIELNLGLPENIPSFTVNIEDAFKYAKNYRPEFNMFEKKKLEATRDVEVAKSAKRQVNLVASYGLNNIGDQIGSIYQNPNDQQRFSIGFNVPIVDWGRRNARYNTAKAIEKLTSVNNEFDEQTIYQEIVTLVKNITLLRSNIVLARKTDSVANRRFTLANNLYQIGKLSVTDLNLAQLEKDNARRTYILSLRDFWSSYYQLRKATLFDFEKNQPLFTKD